MRRSTHSSNGSAPCRLDWRPSRWVTTALYMLALLAPGSLLACDLPRALAWPLAPVALAAGVVRARHWSRRPPCQLVLAAAGRAWLDGVAVHGPHVAWRGPVAFVSWRTADGRRRQLDFWPDTLPPPLRRELRLLSAVMHPAPGRPGMAH